MWILLAFGSAAFAGITAILAKAGIRDVDSTLATALRTVVVVAFAWLMAAVSGSIDTISSMNARSLIFLIASGLATGASWLCYFKALQLGDVNSVVPIDKSSTVLTMLLAIIFLAEPVSWLKVLCMLSIMAGTFLMVEYKKGKPDGSPKKTGKTHWIIYAVLSAVFASLTAILGKVGIENVESNLGTAIRTVVVLIMAWAIVFATGKQSGITSISRRSWVFLVLSGIATGLSWLCYFRALQAGPASVIVPIDKLSIVLTVIFAYFFFREKLSKKALLGLVLMVVGTLLLLL